MVVVYWCFTTLLQTEPHDAPHIRAVIIGKIFVSDTGPVSRFHLRTWAIDDLYPGRVAISCHPRLPLYVEHHVASSAVLC